ncbi:hypothetical protein JHW43_002634 [Diplocarpon mali]|nr:hypothetical protein JHW43_002634 [Diplocarpon mali]
MSKAATKGKASLQGHRLHFGGPGQPVTAVRGERVLAGQKRLACAVAGGRLENRKRLMNLVEGSTGWTERRPQNPFTAENHLPSRVDLLRGAKRHPPGQLRHSGISKGAWEQGVWLVYIMRLRARRIWSIMRTWSMSKFPADHSPARLKV